MQAEILTIGDELCRGEIVDTNSSWLAAALWDLGVPVAWMTSCRDVPADMRDAFTTAAARADLILVSGGLGPTEDDLTVDVLCELGGVAPVVHEPSLARWRARMQGTGLAGAPGAERQVRVPGGAVAWTNSAGAAPGFELSLGARRVPTLAFPGVPRELKALWADHAEARVRQLAVGAPHLARRVYRTFGAGESQIAHKLGDFAVGVAGASVHYQVAFPETLVKLVVRDADTYAAEARLAGLDSALKARLGDLCFAEGHQDSLAAATGRALAARGATLATAESCTGGLLGGLLTDVPGASAWYLGGWVVYANQLKRELGVPEAVLATHGAVSRECVEALAEAARARAGATVGVAISGIAGPDGGTPEKPVGTVHVAVAGPGDARAHKVYTFPGARDQVRRLACFWAMRMVRAQLAG